MRIQIPGYEIGEKIGEGGSSVVYRATRMDGRQIVAVKVLHEKYCEDLGMRKRLLREAEVVQKLNHANVVRIYKSGIFEGRIFMVLQFLDQGALSDYQNMSKRQLLKAIILTCDGVDYIHSNGIIHRDLKPSNIMFGEDEIPRLVDFGISLFSEEGFTRLTQDNMVMGTLSYMSPEQQSNPSEVDARTDIYSLGAILYEIFTHRKPVGRFRNPTEIIKDFDPELERVILKAMAHGKEDRYKDVRLFKADLIALWQKGLFDEGKAPTLHFDERLGCWLSRLEGGTVQSRWEARDRVLENATSDDVVRLLEICQQSTSTKRSYLIPVFGKLKDRRAITFLVTQISDPMLSQSAGLALAEIGDPSAVPALAAVVKKGEVYSYHALVPLAMLSGDKYVKFIMKYLKNQSFSERDQALKALEKAAGKKQVKELRKYMKSETEKDLRDRVYRLVQRLELA